MTKTKIYLLVFLFMIPLASGSNTTFYVTDLNTRAPIYNSSILTMYTNQSLNVLLMTDNLGLAYTTRYNGYAYITKKGYFPLNQSVVSADDTVYAPLIPISRDGIVRIKITDMSTGDRSYCIFYKENNRLHACYNYNDTAMVIVNREYIIRPELRKSDGLLSIKSMDKVGGFFTGSLMPILALFVIALVFVMYLMKAVRKR